MRKIFILLLFVLMACFNNKKENKLAEPPFLEQDMNGITKEQRQKFDDVVEGIIESNEN